MSPAENQLHRFGGRWTAQKLNVLSRYLSAYQRALRDKPSRIQPFKKAYIDGFAGTGSRSDSDPTADTDQGALFLGETDSELEAGLLDGSARIALQVDPPFDSYIFIERSQNRCAQLEDLKEEYPSLAERIRVVPGDANAEIQRLCGKRWSGHRAVMFLDPYGMQVEWDTIQAVAATGAIDLWLLFPLGVAVNRVLTRSGEIPEAWSHRLDRLFGDHSWYDDLYKVTPVTDLFGNVEEQVEKASMEVIGRRFIDRLDGTFPGVVDIPGVLRNSRGSPLYLLCFAAANQKGAPTAMRIARDLLKGLV